MDVSAATAAGAELQLEIVFWAPVGTGVMPAGETHFLIRHLFGDDDGHTVAERIDRRIDRLPGLEGLGLAVGALDGSVRRG